MSPVGLEPIISAGERPQNYDLYRAATGTGRSTEYHAIQGVSRLVDITAGGDFLGLCDHKSSYKHVSDFGRLRSYGCLKLRIEDNDY